MPKIITIGRVLEDPSLPEKIQSAWLSGNCILVVHGKVPYVPRDYMEDEDWVLESDYLGHAEYAVIPTSHKGASVTDSDLYNRVWSLPITHYSSQHKDEDIKVVAEDIRSEFTLKEYSEFDSDLKYLLDVLCFEYSLGLLFNHNKVCVVELKDFTAKQPPFSYEVTLGPNTKQWWVYNNDGDYFIDPPSAVLKEIKSDNSYEAEEKALLKIVEKNPDWLYDKEHWYTDIDI